LSGRQGGLEHKTEAKVSGFRCGSTAAWLYMTVGKLFNVHVPQFAN
jgi:hypothetical protein